MIVRVSLTSSSITSLRSFLSIGRNASKANRLELKEEAVASWEEISIEEHMEIYEKQGMSRKDAMKQVAKDRGVSKRDKYSYLMK